MSSFREFDPSRSQKHLQVAVPQREVPSKRFDDGYGAQVMLATPRSNSSQSSPSVKAAADVNVSNQIIERLYDDIFRWVDI